MTAVSPYAPPRRRSSALSASRSSSALVRRSSSVASVSSSAPGNVALLCLVVQYWDSPPLRRLRELAGRLRELRAYRVAADSPVGRLVREATRGVAALVERVWRWVGEVRRRLPGLGPEGPRLDQPPPPLSRGAPSRCIEGDVLAPAAAGASIGKGRSAAAAAAATSAVSSSSSEGERIRRNLRSIDSVLSYWFAQYPPDVAQKSLWMIASSSVERLRAVDAEIHDKFGGMIAELAAAGGEWEGKGDGCEWLRDEVYEWRGHAAYIVALDQMARHVRRHVSRVRRVESESEGGEGPTRPPLVDLPPQSVLDSLSLSAARSLQTLHSSHLTSGLIPIPVQIFALMPYRHASTTESMSFALRRAERLAELAGETEGMVRRFRSATGRRMAALSDEARREGKGALDNGGGEDVDVGGGRVGAEGEESGGGKSGGGFADEDVLEAAPFDADLSDASVHPVVRATVDFLAERGVEPSVPKQADRSGGGRGGKGGKKKDGRRREPPPSGKWNGKTRRHEPAATPASSSLSSSSDEPASDGPPSEGASASSSAMAPPPPALFRQNLIVSLSGGVDSMVIAHVLYLLRSRLGYSQLKVAAVHVDYGNRPESSAEADFVVRYAKRKLGLEGVTVKRIDGIKRGVTDRDEYERVSREARYESYRRTARRMVEEAEAEESNAAAASSAREKKGGSAGGGGAAATEAAAPRHADGAADGAAASAAATSSALEEEGESTGSGGAAAEAESSPRRRPAAGNDAVPVLLGHHRGDLRENVLSNAHRGCGPLDLSGMTSVSINDGVVLWRPLLSLEKAAVLDYAHRYGVPYFKDTTPDWSTRGQLRNKLLPLLQDIYGEGSMFNLTKLAQESDMASELVMSSVLRPFLDSVTSLPLGLMFDTAPWRGYPPYFWKLALREALHAGGRGMFGDGSVGAFLERVDPPPRRDGDRGGDRGGGGAKKREVKAGWLQMRRDYAVRLNEHGRVYVFHPETFPWREAGMFDCVGRALEWEELDSDTEAPSGTATVIGKAEASVGPWTVTAQVLNPASMPESEAREMLSAPATPSWESLLSGRVTYHLRVPLLLRRGRPGDEGDGLGLRPPALPSRPARPARPLVFLSEFTRPTRPPCWRNGLDLRVERTLPLLGLDGEGRTLLAEVADVDGGNGKEEECGGRISGGKGRGERGEYGKDWAAARVELICRRR